MIDKHNEELLENYLDQCDNQPTFDMWGNKIPAEYDIFDYEGNLFTEKTAQKMLDDVINADGYSLIAKQLVEVMDPMQVLELLGAEKHEL